MHTQIQKAFQLIKKDKKTEAEDIFQKIISIETDDVGEIVERGKLAMELDENVHALNYFGKAVELQPENDNYIYLLAIANVRIGNLAHAASLSQKVIEKNPKRYEAYAILGMRALEVGDFSDAAKFYEKAIQLKSSDPTPYGDVIIALRRIGRHEDALKYAKKLLRLDSSANSYIPISRVLIELGRVDEAIPYLEKAIQVDRACGSAYYDLASTRKFSATDDKLIKKAEKVLQQSVPIDQRSFIHFSLGKMYDDCKEWGKAFEHYRQGNLLGKSAVEKTWIAEQYKAAKKAYSKSFIQQADRYGSDSDVPVFIFGMPRSGTTLTEQIIASHPQGAGAGELRAIGKMHQKICTDGKISAKELENNLRKEALVEYANDYLKILHSASENAERIADKQPYNYLFLGLMYKLFPNARFIHTVRNPLDTCLSCYFQSFTHAQETYDLEWLGKSYRLYREVIDHWKKLLPEGTILDVHYEEVVQDFEKQSRRIIDFCDLPWDASCLEFYKTSRPIVTASLWQVRQPIYSTSRKRWINYAKHLGPLANEISDYLDEEDIAELEKHGVKINRKWGMGFLKRTKR
jgi:tetratricopeptide (TPR) repeat protein